MSAVAEAPRLSPGVGDPPTPSSQPTPPAEKQGMSQGRKVLYGVLGVWIGGIVLFIVRHARTRRARAEGWQP